MKPRGFSLLTLMIALAVLGVALSLGAPALQALVQQQRRALLADQLLAALRSARVEAILRHRVVQVQAHPSGWGHGWQTVLDLNGAGARDPDNPVLVVRQLGARVRVVGNHWLTRSVRFDALGRPASVNGAFQAGRLHLCALDRPVSDRRIVLSHTGRVRLETGPVDEALCAPA